MENMLTGERLTAIQSSFAQQGLLKGLGASLVELRPGRCALELPFSQAVTQQQGFFHGGAIGALADAAGGYAAMSTASDGTEVLTLEYKINFLRPAAGEAVIATGEVLRAGRSIIVTRIDVHVRRDGELILCAAAQQSIVPTPLP
ncbi:PaaI family thioesterase [uncultured Brevundimonas sp.]|uniref:PaaI family thioesterase n=1 Tax=uncultured Brevundimonas sp. TaxID=213418 RepID=UPI002600C1E1|nr:PaaI family thioesterase [uncultured Brevundimonas sp.]